MQVLGAVMMVLLLGGFVLILWGFFAFIRAIGQSLNAGSSAAPRSSADAADEIDGMNEGDIHSGPYGYSANTAYPQTQYGSLFDQDAEWAHEEEY